MQSQWSIEIAQLSHMVGRAKEERRIAVAHVKKTASPSGRRILAAMKPNTGYRHEELQTASGLDTKHFGAALAHLVRRHCIDKTPDRDSVIYSLPC